jgi:hypothetical protein
MQPTKKCIQLTKWHFILYTPEGQRKYLNAYKGTGSEKTTITHPAATKAGHRRGAVYNIIMRKTLADMSVFYATEVDTIRHMGPGKEKLSSWEKADILLGKEDASRLERYLCPGCRAARRPQATSPLKEAAQNSKTGKAEKRTYIQTIWTGVDGWDIDLRVMFDDNKPNTLISHKAAGIAVLYPTWGNKWVMSPDSGEPEESK